MKLSLLMGKLLLSVATLMGVMGVVVLSPSSTVGQTNPDSAPQQESSEADAELAEAEQLMQQVIELYNQGQYADAIPLAERALAIREKVLGAEHPDVATSLNNLALLYRAMGNYPQAEPLLQRALAIREKMLGAEHPDVATSLGNLALLYDEMGSYQQAEPLYQRALAIRERVLGVEHPDVATSLSNLAGLYRAMGNYQQAEPLLQRALAIREKALGAEHPDVAAASLNSLAVLYSDMGNYQQAEPLLQRALAIREKVLGAEHPDVATSLNNLAGLYREMGNYPQAEPLLQRALSIWETVLGAEHPHVAISLNNLALLYFNMGNYQQAEPLLQRALAIREKVLGTEHPNVAISLNNLAGLYREMGNYPQAEPFYQRALSIWETVLGAEHPHVAVSLNNLALLYSNMGNYPQAEPLLQRALAIREKVLGAEHPDVANSLDNLANLYLKTGNYPKAEPLYQRALAIKEKALGAEHPQVASSLNNLEALYSDMGNYQQAESLLQQTLAIREKALGAEHPHVAQSLNNLAGLYWARGKSTQAITLLARGTNIEENNLEPILATGSEAQKHAYMETLSGIIDWTISMHLLEVPNNPEAAYLALTTLLRRKGRILDAVTDNLQTLRENLTPEDQELLDQLAATRSQLAALLFKEAEDIPPEEYRKKFANLKAKANQLENTLSRRSAQFRTESQPVTIEAVQQLIPVDTALIELVQYKPYNPAAKRDERWETPHYAAYILHATGEPQWLDLGEAAPINQTVAEFRHALQHRSGTIKQIARTLDEQLMQPIRQKLGNTNKLLLSPDSQLNLIPFAALVDENNNYLVENYAITYLTSGRDLLKLQHSSPSQSAPLLVANPDYSNPGDSAPIACRDVTCHVSTSTGGEGFRSADSQRSTDLTTLEFQPLPGTAEEAVAVFIRNLSRYPIKRFASNNSTNC
jgi:tetratricopeptide (TPR) repeat protein